MKRIARLLFIPLFVLIFSRCDIFFPPGLYDTLIETENQDLWLVIDSPENNSNVYGLEFIEVEGRSGGDHLQGLGESDVTFSFFISDVEINANNIISWNTIPDSHYSMEDGKISCSLNIDMGSAEFAYLKDEAEFYIYLSVGLNDASDYSDYTWTSAYIRLDNQSENSTNTNTNDTSENLVSNGEFNGFTDWQSYQEGLVTTENLGSTGDPCLMISNTAAGQSNSVWQQIGGPLQPGVYQFDFDYNQDNGPYINGYIEWWDAGTPMKWDYFASAGYPGWSSKQTNFFTTQSYESCRVLFATSSSTPGEYSLVDNVVLQFSGPPTGVIRNPSFEDWLAQQPEQWTFSTLDGNIHSTNDSYTGTNAVVLTNTDGTTHSIEQTNIAVAQNTSYQLRYAMKRSVTAANYDVLVIVSYYDQTMSYTGEVTTNLNVLGTAWNYYYFDFSTSSSDYFINLRFDVTGLATATGATFVDDLSLN